MFLCILLSKSTNLSKSGEDPAVLKATRDRRMNVNHDEEDCIFNVASLVSLILKYLKAFGRQGP